MLKPEITSKIDLGHILQAGVLAVTVAAGWAGGYLTLDRDITSQAVHLATVEGQVTVQGMVLDRMRIEQTHFQDNLVTSVAKLADSLSDLRVLVASSSGRGAK